MRRLGRPANCRAVTSSAASAEANEHELTHTSAAVSRARLLRRQPRRSRYGASMFLRRRRPPERRAVEDWKRRTPPRSASPNDAAAARRRRRHLQGPRPCSRVRRVRAGVQQHPAYLPTTAKRSCSASAPSSFVAPLVPALAVAARLYGGTTKTCRTCAHPLASDVRVCPDVRVRLSLIGRLRVFRLSRLGVVWDCRPPGEVDRSTRRALYARAHRQRAAEASGQRARPTIAVVQTRPTRSRGGATWRWPSVPGALAVPAAPLRGHHWAQAAEVERVSASNAWPNHLGARGSVASFASRGRQRSLPPRLRERGPTLAKTVDAARACTRAADCDFCTADVGQAHCTRAHLDVLVDVAGAMERIKATRLQIVYVAHLRTLRARTFCLQTRRPSARR